MAAIHVHQSIEMLIFKTAITLEIIVVIGNLDTLFNVFDVSLHFYVHTFPAQDCNHKAKHTKDHQVIASAKIANG